MTKIRPSNRTAVFSLSDGNGSPVPVNEVKEFLRNIQIMAYNMAESKAMRDPSKRGIKTKNIKEACALHIVNMLFASAEFEITTLEPTGDLFGMDIGLEVLQDTSNIFKHLHDENEPAIRNMIPDPKHRNKVIRRARAAIPPKKSGRFLSVTTSGFEISEFTRPSRSKLKDLIPSYEESPPVPVTEKYIDAKGFVLVDQDNNIKNWERIVSFEEVDSLLLHEVRGALYTYRFKELQPFILQREEEEFVATFEPLGIIVSGRTDKELYSSLGDEFDFLWADYAQEDDGALHDSGKRMKNYLLDLIVDRVIND